jgi:iron complex transport system permease protein
VKGRLVLPAFLALLAASFLASLATGPVEVPLSDLLPILLGGGDGGTEARVVLSLRLPRAVMALLAGGALASSGAAFQAFLRNPLADPYLLGVSGGAAVGALVALFLLPPGVALPLPLFAFAGAALSSLLVYAAAGREQGRGRERLILTGVVAGAFLNALIMIAVSFAPPGKLPGALHWLMGDLGLATAERVALLAPWTALGFLLLYLLARGMDLLLLGDEAAFQAGLSVGKAKAVLFAGATFLAASVVALCGLVGFVGLVVPHAARLLAGSGHRRLLPASFLLGAAFLLLSDAAARSLSPAGELPVGAVTALFGAPFFLYLLCRKGGRP